MDQQWQWAAWVNQNVVDPVGAMMTVVLACGIVLLPRRKAIAPLCLLLCFMAPGQRLSVGGIDLTPLRIVTLAGWCRVLSRGEANGLRWCVQDYLAIASAVVTGVAYVVLRGSGEAIVNRCGLALDTVGTYFLIRCLISNWGEAREVFSAFARISVLVAVGFAVEWSTGRNLFSVFGGVPEVTLVREGHLRCQGAFPHPILAGCFWASLVPVFIAESIVNSAQRWRYIMAITCSVFVILACASSTPLSSLLIGLLGMMFYWHRRHLAIVRWGTVAAAVALQLLMAKGVLHVFARIDLAGGSTGYHRYLLSKAAVDHLDEWWLIGTLSTAHWGDGLIDITNQYIFEGVEGGLAATLLLMARIGVGLAACGRLMRQAAAEKVSELPAYALGVGLAVHAINFLGVSYFGQLIPFWSMALALVASLSTSTKATAKREKSGLPSLPAGQRGDRGITETRARGRTGSCLELPADPRRPGARRRAV